MKKLTAKELLEEVRQIKNALDLTVDRRGTSNIYKVLVDSYGKNNVKPSKKDMQRVQQVMLKSDPERTAIGQLSRIKDPLKAYTRGLAFENENMKDVASVYFVKATELWGDKYGVVEEQRVQDPVFLVTVDRNIQQRVNSIRTRTLLDLAGYIEVLNSELDGRAPTIERELSGYIKELRSMRLKINKTLSDLNSVQV